MLVSIAGEVIAPSRSSAEKRRSNQFGLPGSRALTGSGLPKPWAGLVETPAGLVHTDAIVAGRQGLPVMSLRWISLKEFHIGGVVPEHHSKIELGSERLWVSFV